MDQQQFYLNLKAAKYEFGNFRSKVNAVKRLCNTTGRGTLIEEISQIVNSLTASVPFFTAIGKKCEVDIYIICYISLLARLNAT